MGEYTATLEGALKVGAEFHWKINGAAIRSTVHTLEQYRVLGWSGVTFGTTAIHKWYLEPHGGGTLVKVEESMEGWLVRIFSKKMNRDLAADMTYWLEVLKKQRAKSKGRCNSLIYIALCFLPFALCPLLFAPLFVF